VYCKARVYPTDNIRLRQKQYWLIRRSLYNQIFPNRKFELSQTNISDKDRQGIFAALLIRLYVKKVVQTGQNLRIETVEN